MRLLVTGAGGMLGRALVGAGDAVGLAREDLDVTDAAAVAERFRRERPQAVINCAAYTDVDGAEAEPDAAMAVNATGARNVARAAALVDAKVAYVSSDYVFDGSKRTPYVESDQVRPLSAYGRSKAAGERETARAAPRHFVARSAWLFGAGGRNFVHTMLRLGADRGQATVVADQVGCPTYAGHLAAALLELVEREDYGIHHLAAAGSCSWHEFAIEIFAQTGLDVSVAACGTADFPRPAPRPAYSVLGTERAGALRLPHWREGLAAYLAERRVAA